MSWGKNLIIFLGLMQLSYVAHARAIKSFTDNQGILHITNSGSKQQGSPATPSSPSVPLRPGSLPREAPMAQVLVPEPKAPEPASKPGAVPVDIQSGSRSTRPKDSGGVKPLGHRTGEKLGPGAAAETAAAQLQPVSWSPPQEAMSSSQGKIVLRRDRQGVIHITNVGSVEAPPIAPVIPTPAVQKEAPSPPAILPAVQTVLCPELGPEVAAYLEAKLMSHSPGWVGKTVRRFRDPEGVWHIVNAPAPDPQSSEARLTTAGAVAAPASAPDPPLTLIPPAMAWGPGLVRPPSGSAPMVVAQRDHRGVMHIFTRASAESGPDRNDPMNFLRRIPPALQSCIIEAANLYQLPIPLILALIQQESNFTQQAVSPKGAMGLMQLMPGTAASLGVRDPFDPRENILAGCRYFRQLLDYFQGNVPLALAGYNAGYNRVISAGCQVPAIKETQEFVTQVMGLYYLLEKHVSGL